MASRRIVAEIEINGKIIKESQYLYDYPFPRLVNFEGDRLCIRNNFKLKTDDYQKPGVEISYQDITDADLKIVRRLHGARITMVNTYYNFELHLCLRNDDEWFIETAGIYQLKNAVDLIACGSGHPVKDYAGIFEKFRTKESFYDLSPSESADNTRMLNGPDPIKEDFQNYCKAHYDEWIDEFAFEKVRINYSDRNSAAV